MYQPIPIPISKGINYGQSEDSLEPGEVADADNFLFRRGEATTRPGRDTKTVASTVTGIDYAQSIILEGTPYTLVIAANEWYSLSAANVLTHITSGGFGPVQEHNAAAVNGVILIGNNTGGLIRWDAIGGLFATIGAAPYRYVCSHTSRAVGAYRTDGAAGAKRNVGYSNAGDENNWITGSAGQTIIADAPDDITGLATVKNVLVVCRRSGFHLGYPTGISLPPFRFELWNRNGIGVYYPPTLANTDNSLFFVAEDDVYMNDLSQLTPIGRKIRDQLIPRLKAGILYRGFVVRQGLTSVRLQYHLHPINTTNNIDEPHYVYDMYEDNWSKCSYDDSTAMRVAFYRYSSLTQATVAQFTTAGHLRHWDDSLPCDASASATLPTIMPGDLSKDVRVDRVMLKYRNHGATSGVRLRTFVDGQERALRSTLASHSIGTPEANLRWMRQWFDTDLNGMGVVVKIEVDPGVRFTTNLAILKAQESAAFTGVAV